MGSDAEVPLQMNFIIMGHALGSLPTPSLRQSMHVNTENEMGFGPQEFGDTGHLVHSGMLASAEWLSDRLSCIAQVTPRCHACCKMGTQPITLKDVGTPFHRCYVQVSRVGPVMTDACQVAGAA